MSSLRTYAILWFSGLIAGVVIMERWRRTGKRLIPPPPGAGGDGGEPNPSWTALPRKRPSVSTVVVAGARTDVQWMQQFVKRVTPWSGIPVVSIDVAPGPLPAAAAADPSDQPR